ncbi:MotE family protein [Oricola indica]|jgi:flagellar motility protein MotE (MotC chaperone)|uniref:MotE family protein n=1 Tax=Oricola indica TaxID=2872591 RepID=UPI001CBCDBB9|nr:MotE family protein [Oricola indica]
MTRLCPNSMKPGAFHIGPAFAAAAILAFAAPASAQSSLPTLLDAPPPRASSDEIQRFCSNIADAARERRYAIQREELEALQTEIEDRIVVLEKKRAELQQWVEKRERFSDAANESLVEVFAKMRPDAAAQRMEKLPGELTAALLTKLSARTAGTILNEMSPDRAALVAVIMAAVADKGETRK